MHPDTPDAESNCPPSDGNLQDRSQCGRWSGNCFGILEFLHALFHNDRAPKTEDIDRFYHYITSYEKNQVEKMRPSRYRSMKKDVNAWSVRPDNARHGISIKFHLQKGKRKVGMTTGDRIARFHLEFEGWHLVSPLNNYVSLITEYLLEYSSYLSL